MVLLTCIIRCNFVSDILFQVYKRIVFFCSKDELFVSYIIKADLSQEEEMDS